MAPKSNLTMMTNSSVNPRVIDFLTSFNTDWEHLLNVMGITRMIKKTSGTTLKTTKATVSLAQTVGEGEEIPYSQATLTEVAIQDITLEKHSKGVSMEEISKNGYDVAIVKTDNAFRVELQKDVKNRFYTFLKTGALSAVDATFQMALAMSKGRVLDAASKMLIGVNDVVAFVNYLDFYTYLGGATITVQSAFGMNYVQDFMGYKTIFLCDSNEIPRNTIIATPVENIVAYYIDPGEIDFAAAGLNYSVMGETPFLGFTVAGNYHTAVSENFAVMGLYLFAEYLDLICVETIEASGSIGSVGLASAAATNTSGATKLTATLPSSLPGGYTVWVTSAASPTAPSYLDQVTGDWTQITLDENGIVDDLKLTGAKCIVAVANGAGQFIATSTATTVTNKS